MNKKEHEKISNQVKVVNTDLKPGDQINVNGFRTELKEIKYDLYAGIDFYWFYNEKGEYKFNVLESITNCKVAYNNQKHYLWHRIEGFFLQA